MKINFKVWKDILTEKVGNEKLYSQARVYLLLSVIAYYITLGFVTWKALKPTEDIGEATLNTIIDALQWAMSLFAGYSFGGKIVDVVRTAMAKPTTTTPSVTPPPAEPPV